jgi:hypothetical protein
MSSYAAGITEGVFTWMVLVAPINTTITAPNFETGTRNSLLGVLAASDFGVEINNQPIKLQKQVTGSENYVDAVSGGQSWKGTFTLNTIGKKDIQTILNGVCNVGTTPVSNTVGATGTLLGNPFAGVNMVPLRFVFVPAYRKADGTFKKLSDMDLDFAWELPQGDIMNGFNPTYNGENFVEYEIELEARTDLGAPVPWKHGSEITLVVTP